MLTVYHLFTTMQALKQIFLQTMTLPKKFAAFLTVRVNRDTAEAFRAKAKEYGGTSQVIRELAEAFVDDRITIKPDPNRKSLYQQ